jgi:hypothetical protein
LGVFGRWMMRSKKCDHYFLTHHELENFSQVETLVLGHLNRI